MFAAMNESIGHYRTFDAATRHLQAGGERTQAERMQSQLFIQADIRCLLRLTRIPTRFSAMLLTQSLS
jgi:hypothetical protein